jgi:hypothetical protein
MCRNCNSCSSFAPRSKKLPLNAFDYIVGNKVGICLEIEEGTPLAEVVENCEIWVTRREK